MRSSRVLLFILVLLVLEYSTAEAVEKSQLVSPLQWQSPEQCRQSPEDLEKFLTRVYTWYLEHHRNNTTYLENLLTPQFYSIYTDSMKSYDGDKTSPYCTDHDADPLLCLYYYPEPLTTQIQAKLLRKTPASATLQLDVVDQKNNQSSRLYVKMVPLHNIWLIDRVTDLNNGK